MHPEEDPARIAQRKDASLAEESVGVRKRYAQEARGIWKGNPL